MYVRRDLAPLIWDLNVLPMAEQAPLNIPVILPEQMRSVDALAVYSAPGAGLPQTVVLNNVPDYRYQYVYVNDTPVLVDPATRRIVYVFR